MLLVLGLAATASADVQLTHPQDLGVNTTSGIELPPLSDSDDDGDGADDGKPAPAPPKPKD